MKRGITKEIFQNAIRKELFVFDDNIALQKIIDSMVQRGYSRAYVSDIMEGNVLLEPLSPIDLGVIADTMYKYGDVPGLNPNIFLEEAEIDRVKNYKIIKDEVDNRELLMFEDVRQIANDMWNVIVPAEKIAQLYRENAVGYDFDIQRDPKLIDAGDSIIKVANVNWVAVEEISSLLLQNLFISNTITFNVPIEHMDSIKHDKKNNRLVITEKVLKILDGFHRSLAIISALREGKIDYNFEMRITCFSVDKARRFIIQEDKRNPINKEYLRSIDSTDRVASITNNINEDSKSDLRGMVVTDSSRITKGDALISFDTMYNAIYRLWSPDTQSDVEIISNYLISFFNELVGMYPDEMKTHIKTSRRFNHINKEIMFVLYLALAKKLQDEKNWKQSMKETLQKINTNISDDLIDEFINTPPSQAKHKPHKCVTMANNIIEGVLNNEK